MKYAGGCGDSMEIRFKLNPKNEKDQVIIKVLSGEYSPLGDNQKYIIQDGNKWSRRATNVIWGTG